MRISDWSSDVCSSDLATVAMELGCDGGLMNTAIAEAKDPILMARAMKAAVEAGRLAYRAGRMGKRRYADPTSPFAGLISELTPSTRPSPALVRRGPTSDEHTTELQSLLHISYSVLRYKKPQQLIHTT